MIFVTVGMHIQGFDRLVREMDNIARDIDEEVIIQTGNTRYRPIHANYFNFKSEDEILQIMKSARLVVAQAGAGTIINALNHKKMLILVPRLARFNEIFDDHQLELYYGLIKNKLALGTLETKKLRSLILDISLSKKITTVKEKSDRLDHLIKYIEKYLKGKNNRKLKVSFVCSHGGHLTEILQLLPATKDFSGFFVAYDSFRTLKLRYKMYLQKNIGRNPGLMLISLFKFLRIFAREKPDIVISTGSEIAIPAFIIAKLLRIDSMYIETWCRVFSPSLTGKIVYRWVNIFLVQWPSLLSIYGKKTMFKGAII